MTAVQTREGAVGNVEGAAASPEIQVTDKLQAEPSPQLVATSQARALLDDLLQKGYTHDQLVERDVEEATRELHAEIARVSVLRVRLHRLLRKLEKHQISLSQIEDRLRQVEEAIQTHNAKHSMQTERLEHLKAEENDALRWTKQRLHSMENLHNAHQDTEVYERSMMELGVEGAAFVPEQAPRTIEQILKDQVTCEGSISELESRLAGLRVLHSEIEGVLRKVVSCIQHVEMARVRVVGLLNTDDLPVVTSRRQMTYTNGLLNDLEGVD